MSQHLDDWGYQPDTTVPTSYHETHQVVHSSILEQPKRRSIIK